MNGCVPLLFQPLGSVKKDRDCCVFFFFSVFLVGFLVSGQKNNRVVYGLTANGPTHIEVIASHFLSFHVSFFLSLWTLQICHRQGQAFLSTVLSF